MSVMKKVQISCLQGRSDDNDFLERNFAAGVTSVIHNPGSGFVPVAFRQGSIVYWREQRQERIAVGRVLSISDDLRHLLTIQDRSGEKWERWIEDGELPLYGHVIPTYKATLID